METNIVLSGVGGQGILSISIALDLAANRLGWQFKQAEVHGMSQRGGEVVSHLRYADHAVRSEVIPRGMATLVLSVEPLEALRYVSLLAPGGALVTSSDPFRNIESYPDLDEVLGAIAREPNHVLLPGEALARQCGSARAANIVLLGASAPWLGMPEETVEAAIRELFAPKGEKVQELNVKAFRAGRSAGEAYRRCVAAGVPSRSAYALAGKLKDGLLSPDAVAPWREVFLGPRAAEVLSALGLPGQRVKGEAAMPEAILALGGEADVAELLAARR